jgi:hypothetical protein
MQEIAEKLMSVDVWDRRKLECVVRKQLLSGAETGSQLVAVSF